MPEQSWEELQKEFDAVLADPAYIPFRPLLTKAEAFIGRKQDDADKITARALVDLVKHLRTQKDAGVDVLSLLDEETADRITVQSGFTIHGDMKQANRDFIDRSRKNVYVIMMNSANELKSTTQSRNTLVPIVPVVMTAAQALELVDKKIFVDEPQILEKSFDELYQYLQIEAADWIKRYGERPQDWKPFGAGPADLTLEQLIANALNGLEEELKELDCPLAASFTDVVALAEGNRLSLKGIRDSGCIVIMDIISIRHPKLQRAFQQTLLDAYPRTSVVTIAPNQGSYMLATKLAVYVQLKVEEMEFLRRRGDAFDYGASQRILEQEEFRPWLSSRLLKIDLKSKRGAPRVV
jgi:hypothetical protein